MATHPLDQWLEANGKTKADLAISAGVSRMALWRVMNGNICVSVSMLSKISQATGIPMSDLIVQREAAQ